MKVQAGAGAMTADTKTRVLRNPPPRRVSALKSYSGALRTGSANSNAIIHYICNHVHPGVLLQCPITYVY